MAIGIVNDEDLERELNNLSALPVPTARVEEMRIGRGEGNPNTPESVRKLVGGEAVKGGHASGVALAKELGLSESSVSAYQEGATSTASMDRPDPGLLSHVNGEKDKIVKAAREKLTLAIDHITADKLKDAKLRDVASVAKDMSAVVRNTEPASEGGDGNKTAFVFLVPPMKEETDFKVIDVKE